MNQSKTIKGVLLSLVLSMGISVAYAAERPAKENKQTSLDLYVTATEAYDAVSKNPDESLLIDIRSPAEVAFVGFAKPVDRNIPYLLPDFTEWDEKRGTYKMVPNSGFTTEVEKLIEAKNLDKSAAVYLMCRSGSRSAKAANLLAQAGYTKVYTVVDGFEGDKAKDGPHKGERVVNGWKNAGLPWSYKLPPEKAYLVW